MGSVRSCGEVGFAYLMTHTISADEVAAEVSPEQMLAEILQRLAPTWRAKARSDDLDRSGRGFAEGCVAASLS